MGRNCPVKVFPLQLWRLSFLSITSDRFVQNPAEGGVQKFCDFRPETVWSHQVGLGLTYKYEWQ
jgi:hypothetical protein